MFALKPRALPWAVALLPFRQYPMLPVTYTGVNHVHSSSEKGMKSWGLTYQLWVKIQILRRYLRLAYELGLYSTKVYERLAGSLNEIGRMTGGWLKKL
jgi:hypothetical protein